MFSRCKNIENVAECSKDNEKERCTGKENRIGTLAHKPSYSPSSLLRTAHYNDNMARFVQGFESSNREYDENATNEAENSTGKENISYDKEAFYKELQNKNVKLQRNAHKHSKKLAAAKKQLLAVEKASKKELKDAQLMFNQYHEQLEVNNVKLAEENNQLKESNEGYVRDLISIRASSQWDKRTLKDSELKVAKLQRKIQQQETQLTEVPFAAAVVSEAAPGPAVVAASSFNVGEIVLYNPMASAPKELATVLEVSAYGASSYYYTVLIRSTGHEKRTEQEQLSSVDVVDDIQGCDNL